MQAIASVPELYPFRFEEAPGTERGVKVVVMASNQTLATGYVKRRIGLDMIYVGRGQPTTSLDKWTTVNHR